MIRPPSRWGKPSKISSIRRRVLTTFISPSASFSADQITNAFSVRDVEMDSWSCLEGWPTQGLGCGGSGGDPGAGEVLAVCRSNEEDVLAVRDKISSHPWALLSAECGGRFTAVAKAVYD